MKKPFYSKGNKVLLKDQDIFFKIKGIEHKCVRNVDQKKSFFIITHRYGHVARLQNMHIWCWEKKGIFHVMHINLCNLLPQDTVELFSRAWKQRIGRTAKFIKNRDLFFLKKTDTYVFIRNIFLHYLYLLSNSPSLYHGIRTKLHSFLWISTLTVYLS